MAEQTEKESKTEEPTEHRLKTALDDGNTPLSRELNALGPLVVVTGLLVWGAAVDISARFSPLIAFLERPDAFSVSTPWDVLALFAATGTIIGSVMLMVVLGIAATSIAFGSMLSPPRMIGKRIKPQLARISMTKGAERIFGKKSLFEFCKSVAKVVVLSIVLYVMFPGGGWDFSESAQAAASSIPHLLQQYLLAVSLIFLGLSTIASISDILWTKYSWRRDLMMSPHEVREEHRQTEGDQRLKQKMRAIGRARTRKAMLAGVKTATVVIANPTHVSVALRYTRGEQAAPVVVAKGADILAHRIRQIAVEHQIPIVEDIPLARGLYGSVDVGKMIPPEFYRAVAKVIMFLAKHRAIAMR
jgi:flagellar biosynthesis protein FlhB